MFQVDTHTSVTGNNNFGGSNKWNDVVYILDFCLVMVDGTESSAMTQSKEMLDDGRQRQKMHFQ